MGLCLLFFTQLVLKVKRSESRSADFDVILSLVVWSIFIQMCAVGSKRRIYSETECVLAVQGHPSSMILVPIESAYAASYLSINQSINLKFL